MSIFLTKQKIIKDWTDYNGHMNVAYYVLIFDQFGSEVLLTSFNMGEHSAKTTKKSTMVVESHITYDQEVKENDEVDINLIYCDHDKKRIQYKLEMIHSEKKYLAATLEALSLYVDLGERKVVEFENEKVLIMDKFIEENKITLNIILEEINKVHDELSNKKDTCKLISSHYNLEKEEVKEWISKTKWSKLQISQENIISTLKFLKKLNLIKDINKNNFIY